MKCKNCSHKVKLKLVHDSNMDKCYNPNCKCFVPKIEEENVECKHLEQRIMVSESVRGFAYRGRDNTYQIACPAERECTGGGWAIMGIKFCPFCGEKLV